MEIQEQFGYLLNLCARFMKRKMDGSLEKFNLTTSQWAVIKLLDTKKELTQAQIADELSSDRATVGSIILQLHKKGYINKIMGKTDRRCFVIGLTLKAIEVIEGIENEAYNITNQALEGLKEDEIMLLFCTLNKIKSNLSKEG